MHCTKCGAELAPESKFCVACGTPVELQAEAAPVAPVASEVPAQPDVAPVATAAPEKEGFKIDVNEVKDQLVATVKPLWDKVKPFLTNKKVLLGIGILVLLLVVASVISSIAACSNGYVQLKQSAFPTVVDGEIHIVVDKKVLKDTVETEGLDDYAASLDGKVMAFSTEEDELYVVNGKKLKKVAEDVYDFELSVSGKGIAYVVKDEDEGDRTLYLYSVGNGKATTITDELAGLDYAIAPDGKSVAYFVEDEEEDELMFSKGKDPVKITSAECELYGISNNGKYIYVSRENDEGEASLYSYNTKGESTKLGGFSGTAIRFNDDHTQVMFYNEGKTYVSTKGKEAEKASSDRLNLIVAPNASFFSDDTSYTYPVSNLYDHVYTVSGEEGYSVWLIKKNADKNVKLVSKVSDVELDASAEYLYYIYDGDELRVIKISDGEKATERFVKLAEDVDGFFVTSDRKYVYYGSDGSVYSVNGKKGGKSTIVCNDDVEGAAMNGKDIFYYILDGDLYATKNGKKGSKVLSDISSVTNTQNGVVYASNEDAFYASNGSKKPSKILDRE